ncbi:hypothetical protein B9Z65_4392 [Elsinoe australis]|uniref:DUF7593 domain-containing protein n=1 Tax=Elsinoe australis TaxID=40998 RepID=A0A2P7Z2P3_9PEZI|nr:hypothetical protein B9Z65_4392 [Elsinoe australis]
MSDTDKTSTEAASQTKPELPVDDAPATNETGSAEHAATEDTKPLLANTGSAVNGDHAVPQDDAGADDPTKDDSEAETVLSSPVKRREAMRKANGVKVETSGLATSISVNQDVDTTSPASSKKSVDGQRRPGKKSKQPSSDKSASELDASFEEDDDADMKSEGVSNRSASRSPENHREGTGMSPNGRSGGNPKKRKHRESSSGRRLSNTDSAKRQRRASSTGRKSSDRSSEELSPPPRLRRHKRTTSGSGVKEDDGEAGTAATQSGRSRRAASHLPMRDQKVFKSTWDSGSESEVSVKHIQSRSTRSINRSVSTPGRPMGRDHKRHVNKYGFTRLAEACEAGDLDMVKEWRQKDPEQLEQREFAGNTPLQVASLNGYPEIVKYLLDEGCNPHCANSDKDTPLIDAVENEHPDVVKLLLEAGVDPLRQNTKGQQALDLVRDDTDTAPEIRVLLRSAIEEWKIKGAQQQEQEEERRDRLGPKQALHFMARTPDNLMKLVLNNDREGVTEFLDARVPVDNFIVAAAAKTGDIYLANMLLAEMSPRKAKVRSDKPMLAALGTSHFEMVKTLTELDQFNPLYRHKQTGMTWHEIAESRNGPHSEKERDLLYRLYLDAQAKSRLSSSPISKRGENGIRRPKSSDLSDEEMEDADSPDAARTKRRLISRKDMRAASNRKSPSTESSRAASSPEAMMKPAETEELRPPKRKPGRPRTASLSSHTANANAKRLKTKVREARESIALFETVAPTKKRKVEDRSTSRPRPVSGSVNTSKKTEEQADDADEDTKMSGMKEEEDRKAELERKEAEEAARREEEERLERERKAAQERAERTKEKLETFPSALRQILEQDSSDPAKLADNLSRRFLPLQAVSGAALGLEGDARDGLWMLNYQAAGLLRGTAATELLQLPTVPDAAAGPLHETERHTVLPTHRNSMMIVLGSTNLSSACPELSDPNQTASDVKAKIAAMKAMRNRLHADTNKFLSMEPLSWISVKEFLSAKADLQENRANEYPHLGHLPALEVALDACLDDSPFEPIKTETIKTESPRTGTPGGLLSPSTPVLVVDEELRKSIGHGLKEGDGRCSDGHLAAIRGMTKVEVVID